MKTNFGYHYLSRSINPATPSRRATHKAIEAEYSSLSRSKHNMTNQFYPKTNPSDLLAYIAHLESSNKNLHLQLDSTKHKHQKQVQHLERKIENKQKLLDECEKEISYIKQQYHIMFEAMQSRKQNILMKTPVHGLLRKKGK